MSSAAEIGDRLVRLESRARHDGKTLAELDELIRGSGGLSLRDRVLILWHSQLWILAIVCTAIGAVLQKLLGLL